MSVWNIELEGFPSQWLDIVDRFENGQSTMIIRCEDERAAVTLRFEWYAFKRKLRAIEKDRAADSRMFPTLPRIRAEIGQLRSGAWALRLALRDIGKSAQAIDAALAMTPEEVEELYEEFKSV